jgi:hypothetical protein
MMTPEFIRIEIERQKYEISLHADDERIADGFSVSQLEFALIDCQIIEQYPDDPMIREAKAVWQLGLPVKRYPFILSAERILPGI